MIACFPWSKTELTPGSANFEALAEVDCSAVEWIDPHSEEGLQIGQRLLSLNPQPPTIAVAFTKIGPIEKVGDWILYQAEKDLGTLYVLGPTSEGVQFFGGGWMELSGDETLNDLKAHLLVRLPEAPLALIACSRRYPG